MSTRRLSTDELNKKKYKIRYRDDLEDDGSQAWCICICCFLVNVIIMGFLKCLGILIIELMKAFKATPVDVSVLVSITLCLNCVAGPLACYLAVMFSARTVAFIGTSMVSFGLMISYFATSMTYLNISIGVFAGFGTGLTYSPGVILIGNYFQKNRGMANGVVVSGSPVGGMIMPYMLNFLIKYLDVRGALLILGGLMMNAVVCTLSYKPYRKPKYSSLISVQDSEGKFPLVKPRKAEGCVHIPVTETNSDLLSNQTLVDVESEASSGPEFLEDKESNARLFHSQSTASTGSSVIVYKVNEKYGQHFHHKKNHQLLTSTTKNSSPPPSLPFWFQKYKDEKLSSEQEDSMQKVTQDTSITGHGQNVQSKLSQTEIPKNKIVAHPFASQINRNSGGFKYHQNNAGSAGSSRVGSLGSSIDSMGLRYRKNNKETDHKKDPTQLQTVSTKKLSPYILSLDHSCVIMWSNDNLPKNLHENSTSKGVLKSPTASGVGQDLTGATGDDQNQQQDDVLQDEGINELKEHKKSRSHKISSWVRSSPLSNWTFILLLISNASTAISTTNILLLIPALGEYRGLSKAEYSTVYLIISLCDMCARLLGSFISDKGFFSPKTIFAVGLFFAGLSSTFIAFFSNSFPTMSIVCAMFGFASGLHIGIYGTLLAEIVGIELLHVGYAFCMILNGALQFSFIYISGQILSSSPGAYTPLYLFYGITLIIGGSMWLIPLFPLIFFKKEATEIKVEDEEIEDEDGLISSLSKKTSKRLKKPLNKFKTANAMSNVSLF